MEKVDLIQGSGCDESGYLVTKSCLRYVVPFVLEESFKETIWKVDHSLSRFMETKDTGSKALEPGKACWVRKLSAEACPDGSYYGKIQSKLSENRKGKSGNGNKKAVHALYERRESDLYEFFRNEFCFNSAEGNLAKEKMGCEWLDVRSGELGLAGREEILSIRYYPEPLELYKLIEKTEKIEETVKAPEAAGAETIGKTSEEGNAENRTLEGGTRKIKPSDRKYYNIQMTNLGLMLFRNGLGLLWYELEFPKKTEISSSQLVMFQNRVRELNPMKKKNKKTGSFFLTVKDPSGLSEAVKDSDSLYKQHPDYLIPFHFGDWIAELLMPLQVHFLAKRRSTGRKYLVQTEEGDSLKQLSQQSAGWDMKCIPLFVPDKAILFTYSSFKSNETAARKGQAYDQLPDDMLASWNHDVFASDQNLKIPVADQKQEMLTYQLTNGYRETNYPGEDVGKRMYRPFRETIWYATQEGTAYLAWPQSEETKRFFSGGILGRIKANYFPLYMKNLYQSFSLMVYAKRVQEEISAVNGEILQTGQNGYVYVGKNADFGKEEDKDLFGEVNLFLAKGMATSVSHIHYQSEYYLYIKRQLRIREDVRSVTAGLDALNILRERRADEEEKRRDNRISAIIGLFALLGVFSAWTDGLDFLSKVFQDGKLAPLSILQAGLVILVLVVAIAALVYTVESILMNREEK